MATASSSPSSRPLPEVLEDAPELEFWRSDSWVDIWSGLPLQMPPEGTAAGLVRSALLPGSNVNFPQITEICERIAAEPPEGLQAVQLLVAAMRDVNAPFRKKLKALTISNELLYDDKAVACFRTFAGFQQALMALRVVQNTGLTAYVDENIRMLATEVEKVCFGGSAPPREGRLQGFGSAFRNNLEAAAGALRRPADQAYAPSPAPPMHAASKPVSGSMPSTAAPQVAPGSMQAQSVPPPPSPSPFASAPGGSNLANPSVNSSACVPNGVNAVPSSPFQVQGSSVPGIAGGAPAAPNSQLPAQEVVRPPPVSDGATPAFSVPAAGSSDFVASSGPTAPATAVAGMAAANFNIGRQPDVAGSFAVSEASSAPVAGPFGQPDMTSSFATPGASNAAVAAPFGQPNVTSSFAMPGAVNAAVANAFDTSSAPPQSGGGASSLFD